ncbi:MAG: HIT family protein [Pseudazoarcus pumilus]|nr:HIT family protein [Pseudazoarcus pumilus]
MTCALCKPGPERILWQDAVCRVIAVSEADYPGFCRVIWHAHVAEMSDLPPAQRDHLMDVVFATERVLRELLQPDKINLASFGNVVPHLHWHVIPRYRDDRHFPQPVWAAAEREASQRNAVDDAVLASALARELARHPSRSTR